MTENRQLIIAGPLEGGGELHGFLIFDVDTVEEILELESEDPWVKVDR